MDSDLVNPPLLLLVGVALIAAAVLPPLLRHRRRDHHLEQFGTELDLDRIMAGRPDPRDPAAARSVRSVRPAMAPPGAAGPTSLPRPEGWKRKSRTSGGLARVLGWGVGLLFLALLHLPLWYLGVGGIVGAQESKHVFGGLISLGFGLCIPALMASSLLDRNAPPPRLLQPGPTGEPALLIPPAHWMRMLLVPLGLLFVGAAGATGTLLLSTMCLGVGTAIWYAVRKARGRLKGLVLTPSGVLQCHRWRFGTAAGWDRVGSLRTHEARPTGEGRTHLMISLGVAGNSADPWAEWLTARPGKAIRVRLPDGTVTVDATMLRCDPVVLYHTLGFYMEHPEARAELGTRAAVDRMIRGDLL